MDKVIGILAGLISLALGFILITKPFFYIIFYIMSAVTPLMLFVDNFFANLAFIIIFSVIPILLYFYILLKFFEVGVNIK